MSEPAFPNGASAMHATGERIRQGCILALLALVWMWPVILNGSAFYFPDSPGYLKGGARVIEAVQARLGADTAAAAGEASEGGVHAVRSVAYSVFAYLTSWPGYSALVTVWVQALILTVTLSILMGGVGSSASLGAVFILSALTPAAWFASYIMPDLFAGLGVLALGLLATRWRDMPLISRVFLGGVVAFSVAAHLSHVPLIGLLVALVGVMTLARLRRRNWRAGLAGFGWVAVPALVGLLGTIAVNAVGFGSASVGAKRFPIVLAAAIEDGPARWYLDAQCADGEYAVCALFPDGFPETAHEFLWGAQGVRATATPEQFEQIRAEEAQIVREAYAAYPLHTAKAFATATLRQLGRFGLDDHNFDLVLTGERAADLDRADVGQEPDVLKRFFELVFISVFLVTFGALGWIFIRHRGMISENDWKLLLIILIGLLANAAICGALSDVTDRYQGRVVWLPSAFLVAVLLRKLPGGGRCRAASTG